MDKSNAFDCPICMQTLLQPISLVCGHTFCKPCLRNKHFQQHYLVCPLCRAPIQVYLSQFKVNVLLEQIIKQEFNNEQYQLRLINYQKKLLQRNNNWYVYCMRIILSYSKKAWALIQKMLPLYLIVMVILMYLTLKQNLRFERFQNEFLKKAGLEKFSEEITRMVTMLRTNNPETKDLDIQNLVFSRIVKYLFTNCVRF